MFAAPAPVFPALNTQESGTFLSEKFSGGKYWANEKCNNSGECKTCFEHDIPISNISMGVIEVTAMLQGATWTISRHPPTLTNNKISDSMDNFEKIMFVTFHFANMNFFKMKEEID